MLLIAGSALCVELGKLPAVDSGEIRIRQLGYKQELRRNFTLVSNASIGFTAISILTGITGKPQPLPAVPGGNLHGMMQATCTDEALSSLDSTPCFCQRCICSVRRTCLPNAAPDRRTECCVPILTLQHCRCRILWDRLEQWRPGLNPVGLGDLLSHEPLCGSLHGRDHLVASHQWRPLLLVRPADVSLAALEGSFDCSVALRVCSGISLCFAVSMSEATSAPLLSRGQSHWTEALLHPVHA